MTDMRKIIAACIVLLLVGMALIPLTNSRTIRTRPFLKNEPGSSELYLDASSSYDYGWKAGKLFRFQYRLFDVFTRFSKRNMMSEIEIEHQIGEMEQYCPFFLEELRGLSASTNIPLERLLLIGNSVHLDIGEACTTTLSTGSATKNNETFLTQNLDGHIENLNVLFWRILSYKWWIVKINTMRYSYAFFGIPILKELPVLNEMGLGFGGNSNRFNESRPIDEGPGMSSYMLHRLTMMTCKNVSEVAELWRETERASGTYRDWPHFWDNENTAWCDKEGGILIIEQTHSYIATVFRNSTDITGASEDILWHANHHQWLNPKLTGGRFPDECPSSVFRAERARELLEENYGNINLSVCKEITRDHEGGSDKTGKDSGDICRHPEKDSLMTTLFSWIVQPKSLTVYSTHGSPCNHRFIKYDFTEKFEK